MKMGLIKDVLTLHPDQRSTLGAISFFGAMTRSTTDLR